MLEDSIYDFEQAQAVVYGRNGGDDITFDAPKGRYEEEKGARLEGGVVGHAGDMTLHFDNVTWEKSEENPVGNRLQRHPVRIESRRRTCRPPAYDSTPESKTFVLTEVSGRVSFGRSSL